MGVCDLLKTDAVKQSTRQFPMKDMKGKKLGVDTDFVIRLFLYALEDPNHFQFLERALRFINLFLKFGILLVWVFDGPSPPWKQAEIEVRAASKKRNIEKLEIATRNLSELKKTRLDVSNIVNPIFSVEVVVNLEIDDEGVVCVKFNYIDSEDISKEDNQLHTDLNVQDMDLDSGIKKIDEEIITEEFKKCESDLLKASKAVIDYRKSDKQVLKDFFDILNIPYIQSEWETDSVLGCLARSGVIDGAISKDSDTLFHECDMYLTESTVNESTTLKVHSYKSVLSFLNMTIEQFRASCFIRGTDYRRLGLRGVGPKSMFTLVQSHKTVKGVCDNFLKECEEQKSESLIKIESLKTQCEKKKQTILKKKKESEEEKRKLILEAETKRDESISDSEEKMNLLVTKKEIYEEFPTWYHDILPKVLETSKEGSYIVNWNKYNGRNTVESPEVRKFILMKTDEEKERLRKLKESQIQL